jgi:deazaflavin-dependent oxidoreductase (nitroreductase family)
MSSPGNFNENLIAEYRANAGTVTGPFAGRPLLLLTTTGAKSGQSRTSPLVYTTDGDRIVVIASKGGAPTSPDWYHNIVANPVATIELGPDKFQVRATIATGEERQRLYDAQAALMPAFADYQQKTSRQIPVVVFGRIG